MNRLVDFQPSEIVGVPNKRDALMIFGSAARGDMDKFSDIDILVVRDGVSRTSREGDFNISFYSPSHLSRMATEGSLFIRHLCTEGVILEDPNSILKKCLEIYQRPQDYSSFREELRAILPLFDITEERFEQHPKKWLEAASFCLRTEVYIRADESSILTFSLSLLATTTDWNEVKLLRQIKSISAESRYLHFRRIVSSLEESLGVICINRYGTLEAYTANFYDIHPIVLSIALRVLSESDTPLNYDLLEPFVWGTK